MRQQEVGGVDVGVSLLLLGLRLFAGGLVRGVVDLRAGEAVAGEDGDELGFGDGEAQGAEGHAQFVVVEVAVTVEVEEGELCDNVDVSVEFSVWRDGIVGVGGLRNSIALPTGNLVFRRTASLISSLCSSLSSFSGFGSFSPPGGWCC